VIAYRLEFHGLDFFRCNIDANPWLEIKSHRCLVNSEFLDRQGKQANRKCHFQLIFDEGTLDLIASSFSCAFLEEIPFARKSQNSEV